MSGRNDGFVETNREEIHSVEAYERKVHGENVEPSREFSTNVYTERRTYGRDANGEIVVRIEKNPEDPVRPVSPVRPFGSSPLAQLDITPVEIPRVRTPMPRGDQIPLETQRFSSLSPRPRQQPQTSPRPRAESRQSGVSRSGDSIAANVPLKKVTRKSRLVNLFDGRPVSSFIESVHFEPLGEEQRFRDAGVILNEVTSASDGADVTENPLFAHS